jgi:hypothetical protein
MPEPGPLGDTFLEARVRAMVGALFVNSPSGGCVESVCTPATHRLFGFVVAPGVFLRVLELIFLGIILSPDLELRCTSR